MPFSGHHCRPFIGPAHQLTPAVLDQRAQWPGAVPALAVPPLEAPCYGAVLKWHRRHARRWRRLLRTSEGALTAALPPAMVSQLQRRVKSPFSVWRKMCAQGLSAEDIPDLLGLRVIVESKPQCYTVLDTVQKLWPPLPARLRDWIAVPKENGYQALHTTVRVDPSRFLEVQIRTRRMHLTDERGSAAHWRYKCRQIEGLISPDPAAVSTILAA